MRLKKLLISGFKSFVDPTDIRLPANLVGVVGPNGCGKSNVIDAVRWVMGESSAKLLRGDNMADVIFNGSASRQPVGKAAVELIFDNNEGKVPGNYGQFSEISIKRTLSRDGISNYKINNIKTRRRDVLDLFRGTGLGPRSYSIIEQGMVSRIVEARPEDLRVFIEEAAGISRYKDRRKETKSRIEHARANLERVVDIRDELEQQLKRLQRQAAAAKRYKSLREEELAINGQLQVLRLAQFDNQLSAQDRLSEIKENSLQEALSDQRRIEAELEVLRKQRLDVQDLYDQIQQEYYQFGAQISSVEQKIEHRKEDNARYAEEAELLKTEQTARQAQIDTDMKRSTDLQATLETMQPDLDALEERVKQTQSDFAAADRLFRDWLTELQVFNEQYQEPVQQVEIQRSKVDYLKRHLAQSEKEIQELRQRIELIDQQLTGTDIPALRDEVETNDQACENAEFRLQGRESELRILMEDLQHKRKISAGFTNQLHEINSRLDSLQEIQNACLREDNEALKGWLREQGLDSQIKLADELSVDMGWERAVDRVLDGYLTAIYVEQVSAQMFESRPDANIAVVTGKISDISSNPGGFETLLDRVGGAADKLRGLLAGVYTASSVSDALEQSGQLKGREIFVTQEGTIVGVNWISYASQDLLKTGILLRRDEINQLRLKAKKISCRITQSEQEIVELEEKQQILEDNLQTKRNDLTLLRSSVSVLHSRLGREETKWQEAQEQREKLKIQLDSLVSRLNSDQNDIRIAENLLQTARAETEELGQQKQGILNRRDQLEQDVARQRSEMFEAKDNYHGAELKKQKIVADIEAVRENMLRLQEDRQRAESKLAELGPRAADPEESIPELEKLLNRLLDSKARIFNDFTSYKDQVATLDQQLTSSNERHRSLLDRVNICREESASQNMHRHEFQIRKDTLLEAMQEQGYDLAECATNLPEDASIEVWHDMLEKIKLKIQKIGPVNLVAIEEFEEQSERMSYLDSQYADLMEALETLEGVIRRIDRESKARFRKTFDKINLGFNNFFPELFGGGKAELHLTSEDLLTAGVSVMARPPGKRNSHIHLLSGGEKALTAVALLFALFDMNPAPFCMLDEVDAPLDDFNVDRYCETLNRLAKNSQMIVITHNKITMESMSLLVGVTMEEAGVSRIVSVDVDHAIQMAIG